MRRRLRHSIGTLLLVGWCLLFLRCETTEKSMVRALYLAQNEATVTVGLLYRHHRPANPSGYCRYRGDFPPGQGTPCGRRL